MLSNLRGLSFFSTKRPPPFKSLRKLLSFCDLEVFHLEDNSWHGAPSEDTRRRHIRSLLVDLQRHQSLQVLAVRVIWTGDLYRDSEDQIKSVFWPKLRALYLWKADSNMLQEIALFNELQILELREGLKKPRLSRCLHVKSNAVLN